MSRTPPAARSTDGPVAGSVFQRGGDPRRVPLAALERIAQACGDIVQIIDYPSPIGSGPCILLNHPELIAQVLIVDHTKFHKSAITEQSLAALVGQGMLTSEGDLWRKQRSRTLPAFRRSRLQEHAPAMIHATQAHLQEWRPGQEREIVQEMMGLTLDIVIRALVNCSLPEEHGRTTTASFLRGYQACDKLVREMIGNPQRLENSAVDGSSVLSMLMAAWDEDGQTTPQLLHDEIMTLLIAGHATTGMALAWTWYLLSENVSAETRLHAELQEVLAGRTPATDDIASLTYLQAVITESLRIYPPVPIFTRCSMQPCNIGGYDLPAGATILMSPWLMHRDERFFEDPNVFRPERWLNGHELRLPPRAYMPFGQGPRRCIGEGFALLELQLVISVIAQQFRLRLVPGHRVIPEHYVTLQPRHGMPMRLDARN